MAANTEPKIQISKNREAWRQAHSLLCVRLDTLGDVIMTTPAIRALRESGQGRRITLLTSSTGQTAARFIPEVDDCIVYDSPWMKLTASRKGSAPDWEMIRQLRSHRFDAAVIFTVYSQNPLPSAMLCYLADIPLRLAYCRENPYQLLTDWAPEREPEAICRHEVRRQLDLVATVGARTSDERLSFSVFDEDRILIRRILKQELGPTSLGWIVAHPGASAASRRYPPEGFSRVADLIRKQSGLDVVFTGTEEERPLVDSIRAQMNTRAPSLAGRLSLGQMAALLEISPLLLSNNTGPVHMAAALGTPVVDLYALTNPQHTPWNVQSRVLSHDVPCKFCYKSVCPEGHHDCLRLIEPESVVDAVLDLLSEGRRESYSRQDIRATG